MTDSIVKNYAKSNKIAAIPITSEHKAKLYELCNNIIENINPNATIYVVEDIIKIPRQGLKEFGYTDCHWFEMVTTHLSFHIMSDPLLFLSYCLDYSMMSDKTLTQHPIDYLYEEYDKIRELFLNKYNYLGGGMVRNKQHFHIET